MKDRHDRHDRKLFASMGPWEIYMKLALITFYTPYWRKVCRMLCNLRRMNRFTFSDVADRKQRMENYARGSLKDTKLPYLVKYILEGCIKTEFKIDV